MKTRGHVKGQLFGYRELPEKSGLWGVLLPRPGEKAVAQEPDAQDAIECIDADRLVFTNAGPVGNRGFLLALLLPFTLVQLIALARFCVAIDFSSAFDLAFIAVLVVFTLVPAAVAFYCVRAYLPPPVQISRRLRKVYAWLDRQKQWIALDYDGLTPVTFVRRIVTSSGSTTAYVLTLCQLKPGTREIEFSVVPAPAQGTPRACGELWEFIRRYMDRDATALPPVRLVPAVKHPKAWMARSDRTIFAGHMDDQHRIKRDWFSMAVVWFWGSLGYWWERAAGWIERTAPRRPLPAELQEQAPSAAEGAYRIIPFTPIEEQAQSGTLPYMRRRWFICGVIGTAVWGWLFGLVAAGIWVMH